MIKLNTPYTIENGDTVIFTEGKKGTINGTYTDSTLTGTLNGELLKATFHNKKVNAIGLIEITFNEKGFDAKWKQGLEPGPMRGKWEGKLNANSKQSDDGNENEKVLLEIFLRYDYPQEEIDSFEIELFDFSDAIQKIDNVNFDYLEAYISKLHSNAEFIDKLKIKLSEYEFYWDQLPQIWITKINDLNLKPLYDCYFNEITDDETIKSILKVNDDVEDWVSDYHTLTVFSVERLN